jgi:hypothetical protein
MNMGLHLSFYSRGQRQEGCSAGWTGPERDRQLRWHYVSVSSSAGAALERGGNLGLSHVTTGRDYVATPVGGERQQRSTNMQLIRGRPGRTLGRRPHSAPLSFGLTAVGGVAPRRWWRLDSTLSNHTNGKESVAVRQPAVGLRCLAGHAGLGTKHPFTNLRTTNFSLSDAGPRIVLLGVDDPLPWG